MRDHKEKKQRNQESDHQKVISNIEASSTPPSSNSSSPSHEFSFTISFQQTKQIPPSTSSSSSFAIDLSPADDIFFHGHLLPLHLLSHLPISSPRSSTNSLDSFTLPTKDHFFEDHKVQKSKNRRALLDEDITYTSKGKQKAKSFSLFGTPKWRKGHEVKDQKENKERSQQYGKKMTFDMMTQVVKRYIRMVRPFLSFRSKRNMQFHRQSYSFSGNLLRGKNKEIRQYSAPASMRTSPTNSGLLVATPTGGAYNNYTNSSSSDSTMEELQAAIQAAIAHCKKSVSMEDKNKLP
ncbi:BRI1 kinase inhibitor 1-like [Lycium ferocissimum]|uniref:BRI1 kinase inhibitor 1-like n=1 Tax=Lycium ferocissimum TaxID=112874 RepID=UPI0028165A83|nr:BRI1 kinase inhibitor 1-like [Lycium ferocissimum]